MRTGETSRRASGRRAAAWSAAPTLALAIAAGCGLGDAPEPLPPPGVLPDAGSDVVPPPEDAAPQWGIPSRPSNSSCLAPARETSAFGVKLEWVYQSIRPDQPTEIVAPPAALSAFDFYVLEQTGRVLAFNSTSTTPLVALDYRSVVVMDGEAGLLGLAFHPSFPAKRLAYMYYTVVPPVPIPGVYYQGKLTRMTVANDGTFEPASEVVILTIDNETENHNGGKVAFGPDGYLYLSLGDTVNFYTSPDLTSLHGKILRIDVDGAAPYAIPPTNPFASATNGTRKEIWASGFRNPWRFSFDSASGDLWVGDVGSTSWEEMNKVEKGGDYGWPFREGAHCTGILPCKTEGLLDPYVEHPNSETSAIVGGVVYHGAKIPALRGKLVYGTLGGPVYALDSDVATGAPKPVLLNPGDLGYLQTAYTLGRDGEVYFTEYVQKSIYKLVPTTTAPSSPIPDRLSKTGCVDPADPKKLAPGLVPFTVASELWSDGAEKTRAFAIPDGAKVKVSDAGKLELPPKSVTLKTFSIGGKRVETRLFVRHDDGAWSGFTYAWNDAQTDADLVVGNRTAKVGATEWYWPSRAECLRCHNENAGRSLGLEVPQLEIDFTYPNGARGNQIDTLLHADLLDRAPPARAKSTLSGTARGYLHANCSFCHRPGAVTAAFDLRATSTLADVCNVAPVAGDLGIVGAKLIAPGDPAKSMVSVRMHRTGAWRMPPIASRVVDPQASSLIDPWIRDIACR